MQVRVDVMQERPELSHLNKDGIGIGGEDLLLFFKPSKRVNADWAFG